MKRPSLYVRTNEAVTFTYTIHGRWRLFLAFLRGSISADVEIDVVTL